MDKYNTILDDFIKVCILANSPFNKQDIEIKTLTAGDKHIPPKLPEGYMAIYIFIRGDICYKVGKVGANSNARYQSQHYNPGSCQSNLAKSLLNDSEFRKLNLDINEQNIGKWIKKNTTRINFLMKKKDISILNLLESFLQCRLKPKYEGHESQKIKCKH